MTPMVGQHVHNFWHYMYIGCPSTTLFDFGCARCALSAIGRIWTNDKTSCYTRKTRESEGRFMSGFKSSFGQYFGARAVNLGAGI